MPLAGALLAAGELEEALEYAQRRTRETPSDPQGWRVAAAVLLAEGYDDEARATLEQGLAANPGSPPLMEALVHRALAARHPAEARRLAESDGGAHAGRAGPAPAAGGGRLLRAGAARRGHRPGPLGGGGPARLGRGRSWRVASYCQQAGRLDDAIAAVERASSLPGQRRQDYQARLDELTAARAAQSQRRMTDELLK